MTDLRTAAQQALEALEMESNPTAVVEVAAGRWELKSDLAIAALRAALAEPVQEPVAWLVTDCIGERYLCFSPPLDSDQVLPLYSAPPQRPAEPVQCEPQYANEDGWCEWVCPNPTGYLMQCCDCGLIHEVDSRVAKYQPRPSEEFEVVDDPDLQVQWRMKRRDDISPKQPPQRPAEPVQQGCDHCNHPLYAAIKCRVCGRVTEPTPPQRKPLAEWQINDLMADIDPEDRDSWSFRQGVYAAEKHHGVRK